ncbi:MAG: cyclic nucleotide-binding domain-containing protein [Acidobacteriota bacterium]|jgi:signal-transduction protein with cAMP-binding, CBS, and nucleotidyltransferase domain
MKLTEKIFGLKETAPFDRLGYSELVAIAEISHTKRFAPGDRVVTAGHVLQRLFAVVEGGVVDPAGSSISPVFGVRSLLGEIPVAQDVLAGPQGAVCLLISKGHFYRIVNEFPEFTLGFLDREDAPKSPHEEADGP